MERLQGNPWGLLVFIERKAEQDLVGASASGHQTEQLNRLSALLCNAIKVSWPGGISVSQRRLPELISQNQMPDFTSQCASP